MKKLACACIASVLVLTLSACATHTDPVKEAIDFGVRRDDPDTQLLSVDAVSGNYARVTVTGSGHGYTETEYLEKQDGWWLVMARGTRINPYTLGIPKHYVDNLAS